MKRALLLGLCVISMFAPSQTAEQRQNSKQYNCILDIKQKRLVIKKTPWATDYGSSDKVKIQALKYSASIAWNMKAESKSLTCEVIWMASKSDGRAYPLKIDAKTIEDVKPMSKHNLTFISPIVRYRECKYVALGEHTKEGYILKGVIFRLKDNGKIIRVKTTQTHTFWQKLAWQDDVAIDTIDENYVVDASDLRCEID